MVVAIVIEPMQKSATTTMYISIMPSPCGDVKSSSLNQSITHKAVTMIREIKEVNHIIIIIQCMHCQLRTPSRKRLSRARDIRLYVGKRVNSLNDAFSSTTY